MTIRSCFHQSVRSAVEQYLRFSQSFSQSFSQPFSQSVIQSVIHSVVIQSVIQSVILPVIPTIHVMPLKPIIYFEALPGM